MSNMNFNFKAASKEHFFKTKGSTVETTIDDDISMAV